MIKITYPDSVFRTRRNGDRDEIFDTIRKKWLRLTPEEWVRQHFVRYMTEHMKYPTSLIALEKQVIVGERLRRFDILIYDRALTPWMMVECKAADIPLNDAVLEQVLRYQIALPVRYLVITNGDFLMVFEKVHNRLLAADVLPAFPGGKS